MEHADMEMRPGERLELEHGGLRYISTVAALEPEGTVLVSVPLLRRSCLSLQPGETVSAFYFRSTGIFSFLARMAGVIREGEEERFRLELRSPISKHQRRDFIRFEAVMPVTVRILSREAELIPVDGSDPPRFTVSPPGPGEPEPVEEPCHSLDLSGGGLRFLTSARIPEGAVLECRLPLAEETTVWGYVSGVEEPPGSEPRYVVRLRFVDVTDRQRQNILRHIYQEQIRQRRLGRSSSGE